LVVGVKGLAKLGQGGAWVRAVLPGPRHGRIDGVGYTFGWGDLIATYRYTEYQMESDQALQDLTLSGPTIGATFRW
jgi:hypothetical protein